MVATRVVVATCLVAAVAGGQPLPLELAAALVGARSLEDQDGDIGFAVAVECRLAGKRDSPVPTARARYVLGAGKDFGNGGDDFEWLDVWSVEERRERPDALGVEKEGAASATVLFKGGRYRWEQAAD